MTRVSTFPTRAFATRCLLRSIHLGSAGILGTFVLLHFGNHAAGLAGQEIHRTVQVWLRLIYQGWMEPVLLLSCLVQLATGLRLAWAYRLARGRALLQPLSGMYIALFLSIHVFAVLAARADGIETDLAFAAAGMHAGYWGLFFTPYYGLAVFLVGLHLAVPLGRRKPFAARILILTSAALAVVLVMMLAGVLTPLRIPPELIEVFMR